MALPGPLLDLPFQLVWWTVHDLWLSSSWIIMIPSLPADVMDRPWDLPFQLVWWTGQPSLPVGVPDRPTFLSSWWDTEANISFQLVWWTGHDLWFWLLLDHYETFPSSWCDGQAMIYDCGTSWMIMRPSLPAGVLTGQPSLPVGVMDRPTFLSSWCDGQANTPFQLMWWTGHDLWL